MYKYTIVRQGYSRYPSIGHNQSNDKVSSTKTTGGRDFKSVVEINSYQIVVKYLYFRYLVDWSVILTLTGDWVVSKYQFQQAVALGRW